MSLPTIFLSELQAVAAPTCVHSELEEKARRHEIIQKGKRGQPRCMDFDKILKPFRIAWEKQLKRYFNRPMSPHDPLVTGIGFSCAEQPFLDYHYTWECFYHDYGEWCVMVAVYPLVCNTSFDHGDKISTFLEESDWTNDPTKVKQVAWVVDAWICCMEIECRVPCQLPNTLEEKELLEKYKQYKQDRKPVDDKFLIRLIQLALPKLPWWMYADKRVTAMMEKSCLDFKAEFLNEFQIGYGSSQSEIWDTVGPCTLAIVKDGQLVYTLPLRFEPGSRQARVHFNDHFVKHMQAYAQ